MGVPLTRRQFLGRALGGVAAVGAVGGGAAVTQAYRFEVNTHSLVLPGLRAPLRVALLADLHYGPWVRAGSVRAWVAGANAARPDLTLLLGDFLDADLTRPQTPLLTELARLRAPLGVYGVWGNHDYGSFGAYGRRLLGSARRAHWALQRDTFERQLARVGVRILTNASAPIRPDLRLAGLDDAWWGQPDLKRALTGLKQTPTLLMSHNPDLLPEVPAWVGLTVSGHTHGGQVRLPLVGAPVVPSRYGQRFAQGFVTGDLGARGFVSRGLGVSGLPLRNLCAPEVVVLDLRPA